MSQHFHRLQVKEVKEETPEAFTIKLIVQDELKDYYKPEWNLEKGALELINFFKKISFNSSQFRGISTNRLLCLSNLILDKKLDNKFRKKKTFRSYNV